MMNKRIRSMIDDIFSEMKMSAENLALRDELLSNAQARYDDLTAEGRTEDEAFREVAASLGDVRTLLDEMNAGGVGMPQSEPEEEPESVFTEDAAQAEEPAEEAPKASQSNFDLGDILNKTVSTIGDFGQQVMPQTKRIVREMDKATGGMLRSMGKAINKGMRDASKAAGDTIDKMKQKDAVAQPEETAEAPKADNVIILPQATKEPKEDLPPRPQAKTSAAALRKEAENLRGQAAFKSVTGDAENAAKMIAEAEALEARAELVEQEEAMEAARRDAQSMAADVWPHDGFTMPTDEEAAEEATEAAQDSAEEIADHIEEAQDKLDEAMDQLDDVLNAVNDSVSEKLEELTAKIEDAAEVRMDDNGVADTDYIGADGEVDEDAFAKAVENLTQEAEEAARATGETVRRLGEDLHRAAEGAAAAHVGGEQATSSGMKSFSPAGLREVEISVDAESVRILPTDENVVEVSWKNAAEGAEPIVQMKGHTLNIRRRNPDLFKSFFSVFNKAGGEIMVRVPRGYAADYKITTTSGDIRLYEIDVDDVEVSTTSGTVRLETDANVRGKHVEVNSVSGAVTISATAQEIEASTVSGQLFVSCDAESVDTNTVSGKTRVEGSCESWEVNSVSGFVEMYCTTVPGKSVKISTMSGSAMVALPGDIRGFAAHLSGMSGSIKNDFGPNAYGTCALPVRMETMSGNLRIVRL